MTNKQKQIEELAEEIYQNSPCACLDYDETKMVAGWLYKAGSRKLEYCENLTDDDPADEFICSVCGLTMEGNALWIKDEDSEDEWQYAFVFQFCPRCGRKVKGSESDA